MPLKALSLVVLVIGKAQFRRDMLSCDSSCLFSTKNKIKSTTRRISYLISVINVYMYLYIPCCPILLWGGGKLTVKTIEMYIAKPK